MAANDVDITAAIGNGGAASGREPGHRLKQLLRADIIAGRIPAGSRLKVSDVIARYGTSTNPAREALHALEGEGLVVITPNRGARVRSKTTSRCSRAIWKKSTGCPVSSTSCSSCPAPTWAR